MTYNRIYFYEGEYCVRSIVSEEDQLKVYRLRHDVFCQILCWVPPSLDELEIDNYDEFSKSIGVFSEDNELLGTFRFVPPGQSFMLETEFSSLLDMSYQIRKKNDTAEVTRFTVAPWLREKGISPGKISKLLYKGMYQWSLVNDVRYLYVVVEKKFWRALVISGYPYEPIGATKMLPPANAESLAAILDWEKFRLQNQARQATFLNWITKLQLSPVPSLEQWHGRESKNVTLPGYFAHGT